MFWAREPKLEGEHLLVLGPWARQLASLLLLLSHLSVRIVTVPAYRSFYEDPAHSMCVGLEQHLAYTSPHYTVPYQETLMNHFTCLGVGSLLCQRQKGQN